MSLLPVARVIANGALRLGGSTIIWYKAQPCPANRYDGSPCYDNETGSNWIDCTVCSGTGMAYSKPRTILGIYTDNSNEFLPDGNGGFFQGKKTLSLPYDLEISLMKFRGVYSDGLQAPREVLKDKFVILSPEGKVAEVMYLEKDPIKPTINSGTIYQYVEVSNN